MKPLLNRFIQFLDDSPTSYHAVHNTAIRLVKEGFSELFEDKPWKIKKGHSYFVRRSGSVFAFKVPLHAVERAVAYAAHTDSPALKLKPQGEFSKDGFQLLHFEVYGAPILATWIGRELYMAGRVFLENAKGQIQQELVSFKESPIFIPNLAVHLDRTVNESGLLVNKQEHLVALSAESDTSYLKKLFGKKRAQHAELFAVPLEGPRLCGASKEWLTSYRLDNLASVVSSLEAFLQIQSNDTLSIISFFNHEEIGSETYEGAESAFFNDCFRRICFALKMDLEQEMCMRAKSYTISSDVAHACHPNHADKHDARHQVQLGKGIVVKTNAGERYASPFDLTAKILQQWNHNKIPFQFFSSRNDIPSGMTIGPIHAAKSDLKTIDLGLPLLGMHAAREMIAVKDYEVAVDALRSVFSH